jgi:LasA protease
VICLTTVTGCIREQTPGISVSEVPQSSTLWIMPVLETPPFPTPVPASDSSIETPMIPTVVPVDLTNTTQEYEVQSGDTLSGIAANYGVSLESILAINVLENPDVLSVGQVIQIPSLPDAQTPSTLLFPDQYVVHGPDASTFDVQQFTEGQPGFIRSASDTVDEVVIGASAIVQRVSLEYSVDPRLLLALLEYRAGWLSGIPNDDVAVKYPIQLGLSPDGVDRKGLYRQLAWAANQINRGYYGWKYRHLKMLELSDSTRMLIAPSLNAGTVSVQYLLALLSDDWTTWNQSVSNSGLYQTYAAYFGELANRGSESVLPQDLVQPMLTLPFQAGETWFFTGGPHGGWGSGSAWAAIDFAPPDTRADSDPPCYKSEFAARAVAPGIIARAESGVVVLDLDGDGNESTGWTILYLHIDSDSRVAAGLSVATGDIVGYPSCEGGVSNATHLHIARRYNGEWIPADCSQCDLPLSMVLGGWTIYGYEDQEYQGYMLNGTERREAEQGRILPINQVFW